MPAGVMRSIGVWLMSTSRTLSFVVDVVVTGLERDAAGAEAVVFRDQFLGDVRVFDALAVSSSDEVDKAALAWRSVTMSRKLPCHMPKPRLAYRRSHKASRSSGLTSKVRRGSGVCRKQAKVPWHRWKMSG